ncbi:Alpha/Beta hydrolase protein [Suillus fuscotomentosus]|uniref:Alpha/Beta hydrolase protein n=1 Tax=Suillus fuscotomentosus TaxID=1912939 RepID=A0AAD4HKY7_9AGAM|nr:Alpha/Beta hydrolase protein [Suillus fuscotomentosus]KAG1899264.1 Alpha/Beta hydrolase protein [Suillus fuscotomentosus]
MAAPQAIDPEILPRLDPEYVAFHNKYVAHLVPPHSLPWDPAIRKGDTVPGSAEVLSVGSVQDYHLSHCKVRVFTPEGTPPPDGWPAYVWYHGGGWTLGNISSENAFCSRLCKGAKCVVASPDYLEDSFETLQWVFDQGKSLLGVDPTRLAVGGSSAGGNLAAIISMKAAELKPLPIRLKLAQLIVPVTDNTALHTDDRYPSWKENANTVWLNTGRMLWFLRRTEWDNSPIFAPDELLAKSPKTWIAVMELDILRDEGLAYGERLKKVGVPVSHKQGNVLSVGRELVSDAVENLAEAFGTL